jgi:hypothetical protein
MRLGGRSGRPLWQVRSVINQRHGRCNSLESTEGFRVHIFGEHPSFAPVAPILQELSLTTQIEVTIP